MCTVPEWAQRVWGTQEVWGDSVLFHCNNKYLVHQAGVQTAAENGDTDPQMQGHMLHSPLVSAPCTFSQRFFSPQCPRQPGFTTATDRDAQSPLVRVGLSELGR